MSHYPSPSPDDNAPISQLYPKGKSRSTSSHSRQYHTTENISRAQSSSHPRPEAISPHYPPRKKMRRPDSEERREQYTARSSPSISSQSDRGDHGSDGEHHKPSTSPTTYEFAEPKKKRTRTLTTPHQAAVLHALLAQSRFPTTAMREEVGKQIGLSARKVQIWFQNQRQKARRPPPQSAPSTSRPPASYGAPGGALSAGLSTDFYGAPHDPSGSHLSSSRQTEHPWASGQRRRGLDGRFLPPEDAPQSLTPGFWLSGPGMPGATSTQNPQAGPSSSGQRVASPPTHHSCYSEQLPAQHLHHRLMPPRRHSQSPPRMRTTASHTSSIRSSGGGETRERSFSRTLPPLVFDTSRPRGNASPSSPSHYQLPSTTRSAPSAIPSLEARPESSHSESPFAHDAPEPRPSRDIPAPFTLQPMPQWDNSSFGSHSRPSTSSWSRPSTSYSTSGESLHPIRSHERLVSDLVARQQVREAAVTPRPNPISRRFDPVYDSVSVNEANRYSSSASSSGENSESQDQEMGPQN